jgi:hypothetical protein
VHQLIVRLAVIAHHALAKVANRRVSLLLRQFAQLDFCPPAKRGLTNEQLVCTTGVIRREFSRFHAGCIGLYEACVRQGLRYSNG